MQRTAKAHIDELERILRDLHEEIMHQPDVRLRNDLEAQIRAANMALKHYRTALEIEQGLVRIN